MRVIAGTFRSRLLQAPRGLATRPTSDRLRESLFSVLGSRVQGAAFADLYAGSGAVGIEALSRGAATVYFSEKAQAALQALRGNLRALAAESNAEIAADGTAALLRRLGARAASQSQAASTLQGLLDLVYLDPPYEAADEYRKTLDTLGGGGILRPDALVIAEHSRRTPLPVAFGLLQLKRTLLQGDAALSFYAAHEPEQAETV